MCAPDYSLLKAAIFGTYGRNLRPRLSSPPPPSPVPSPQSKEVSYDKGKALRSPPPPPILAPPIGQLGDITSPCAEGVTPCYDDNYISMVTDFGRRTRSPPPPPMSSSPPRQIVHEISPPTQHFLGST
ncbi:conserved hypothetical protein [Ricinus communis]|uniref:Uncharacterized protein n=1 Tax=Ricinus communis TaxID=3988 RepID=B9RGN9_RICCO|nr:conserved hypothetical protein [Ricinus communis]